MTRTVLCALAIAGCLSEPPRPANGSGSNGSNTTCVDSTDNVGSATFGMRQAALVGDVDGDGFDDIVTWGHRDGFADGSDAALFVSFGSAAGPGVFQEFYVTFNAPLSDTGGSDVAWTEPITASLAGSDVVVLIAHDTASPAAMAPRFLYIERLSLANRTLTRRAISGMPPQAFIGGYLTARPTAYVLQRANEIVAGDACAAFSYSAALDDQTGPRTLAFESPSPEQGMVALPSHDLLAITEDAALVSQGSDASALDFGTSVALVRGSGSPRVVHAGELAMPSAIATSASSQYVAIVTTSTGPPAVSYLLPAGSDVRDVALADLDGNGAPDVIAIEGNALVAYLNLSLVDGGTATPASMVATSLDDTGEDLLAIGRLTGPAPAIVAVTRTTFDAPQCFVLSSGQLTTCPP